MLERGHSVPTDYELLHLLIRGVQCLQGESLPLQCSAHLTSTQFSAAGAAPPLGYFYFTFYGFLRVS